MSTFQKVKIKDIGMVITGKTPPTSRTEFYGGAYPFITPTDISDNSIYVCSPERYLTDEGASMVKSSALPKNAICYTCIASIGKLAITKEKSFTNQQINSLVVNEKNDDYRFVFYLLKQITPQIKLMAGGVASPIVNKTAFENIEINIPDHPTQTRIASVLSAYDDLIENNEKRIKALEEMAMLLYTEWFVKFKFPGHEKVKMIDSGTDYGMVPEGWEVRKFYDVVNNLDSKRKPISSMKRQSMQGIYPYYGAAKIIDYVNDYIFDGRYLLIAEDGSVITPDGKPMLQFVDEKFWVSNHAHIIQGKLLPTEIIYLRLRRFNIKPLITGAAQPKITKDNLSRVLFIVPDDKIKNMFTPIVREYFDEIFNLYKQNTNSSQIRDLLIPQLVTGKRELK